MQFLKMKFSYFCCALVVFIQRASSHDEYTGIYSTFPLFEKVPLKEADAIEEGYTMIKECSDENDEYGIIYSKQESVYLPGLMYNTHGQLCGMVFGVNKTDLLRPEEDFAPFWYQDMRGQVYWFRDPNTICNPNTAYSDSVAHGIWIKMPETGFFRLPEQPDYSNVGYNTASHWTEHLCVVGMGTHIQYGECESQYQFTALYDAQDALVGVVNALNLDATMVEPPELIEVVPSQNLLGLVFNETRFDPCYNLAQPRIFIHVYLKKPELEYQSCDKPAEFTPMNNPTKRCNLCFEATKSLSGATCSVDVPSMDCCCEIYALSNQDGGCRDQGCTTLPSGCEDYDMAECTSGAGSFSPPEFTFFVFLCFNFLVR